MEGQILHLEKSLFLTEKIDYLRYEIPINGVGLGKRKIESVINFPEPRNFH